MTKRINQRVLLSIRALRHAVQHGIGTKRTYSVDVPTGEASKTGCQCGECVDTINYSGHAYIIGDWYIVIGHRRKDA